MCATAGWRAAVTSRNRSTDLLDLPTMVENGYPDSVMMLTGLLRQPVRRPPSSSARTTRSTRACARTTSKCFAQFQVEPQPGIATRLCRLHRVRRRRTFATIDEDQWE